VELLVSLDVWSRSLSAVDLSTHLGKSPTTSEPLRRPPTELANGGQSRWCLDSGGAPNATLEEHCDRLKGLLTPKVLNGLHGLPDDSRTVLNVAVFFEAELATFTIHLPKCCLELARLCSATISTTVYPQW
jgi:hypothetical protein